MSNEIEKRRIGDLLAAYVAQTVPDDVDLWPAIAAHLEDRQRETGWARLWQKTLFLRPFHRLSLIPIAAILLIGLLIATGFPWSRVENGSATELFNNLSRVAAAQSAPAMGPGGSYYYYYSRSEEAHLAGVSGLPGTTEPLRALVPSTRESWIAPDGSGRIRQTAGTPVFLAERDRARWHAAGSPDFTEMATFTTDVGPGPRLYESLRSVPLDPKALAAAVRDQAVKTNGPPVDVEMFVIVADLLRSPDVSPAMRAALYKVAAQIKGVEMIGKVTDRAGRPGVAVARSTNNWGPKQRDLVIFDPTTSRLLAEERILLERADYVDAEPPVLVGYALYLESSIVPSVPGPPLSPAPTPEIRIMPPVSERR